MLCFTLLNVTPEDVMIRRNIYRVVQGFAKPKFLKYKNYWAKFQFFIPYSCCCSSVSEFNEANSTILCVVPQIFLIFISID